MDGVFGPSGREMGYYNGVSGVWWDRDIWVAGRMIAQSYPGDTYFLHANPLHSDTQITDYSGAVQTDFVYYPWQNWKSAGNVVDAHFAGFEQSPGPNYPTPTRKYADGQGRWLSPDPLGGDITNPQSLNRYAYALNNPTTLTDPLGLDPCWDHGSYEGSGSPPPCSYGAPVSYTLDGVDVPGSIVGGALQGGFALPGALAGTNAQLISSSGGNFQYSYPVQIGTETVSVGGISGQSAIYGTGIMNFNVPGMSALANTAVSNGAFATNVTSAVRMSQLIRPVRPAPDPHACQARNDLTQLLSIDDVVAPFEARIVPATGMIVAGGGIAYGSIMAIGAFPPSAFLAVPVMASGIALAGEGIYYGITGQIYAPSSCH